jgi:hypothetical protein
MEIGRGKRRSKEVRGMEEKEKQKRTKKSKKERERDRERERRSTPRRVRRSKDFFSSSAADCAHRLGPESEIRFERDRRFPNLTKYGVRRSKERSRARKSKRRRPARS